VQRWGLKIDGMIFALAQKEPIEFADEREKRKKDEASMRQVALKKLTERDAQLLGLLGEWQAAHKKPEGRAKW
jgi:hypothetical protein